MAALPLMTPDDQTKIRAFLDDYKLPEEKLCKEVSLGPFRFRVVPLSNSNSDIIWLIGPPNERGEIVPERCGHIRL